MTSIKKNSQDLLDMLNPFESLEQKLDLILDKLSKLDFKQEDKMKGWGNIDLAREVTGYSKSTIYIKCGKGEIPFVKQDGKLWFNRNDLLDWIGRGKK